MARIRYIKPQFFSDTRLADISVTARLFYVGLFCQLDRGGVGEDDPKLLKREIFPYDDSIGVRKIELLITEIVNAGRLVRFTHAGKRYLYCPTFAGHQNFHRDEIPKYQIPKSVLLAACQNGAGTVPKLIDASASTTGNGELRTENGNGERATGTENGAPRSGECKAASGGVQASEEKAPTEVDSPPVERTPPSPAPPDFSEAWAAYPRKVGKTEARDRFHRLIKTPVDHASLLASIGRFANYSREQGTEEQFIPYMATFLGVEGKERWRDWLDPETGTAIAMTSRYRSISEIMAEDEGARA